MSSVAKEVVLEVEFDRGLSVSDVYGYEPILGDNRVTIPLEDMNSGLTQLVMLKFSLSKSENVGGVYRVRTKLSYFDKRTNRRMTERDTVNLRLSGNRNENLLADSVVRKNYSIAELAEGIRRMSVLTKRGEYRKAAQNMENTVRSVRDRYPNLQDKDITFVFGIADDYRQQLSRYLRKDRGPGTSDCDC